MYMYSYVYMYVCVFVCAYSIGNSQYRCPRAVSTAFCIHDVECLQPECNGHGSCDLTQCSCDPPWTGEVCDQINCFLTNCSMHGNCSDGEGGREGENGGSVLSECWDDTEQVTGVLWVYMGSMSSDILDLHTHMHTEYMNAIQLLENATALGEQSCPHTVLHDFQNFWLFLT